MSGAGTTTGMGGAQREIDGPGLVELLEGMALVQGLASIDPREPSDGSLLEQVAELVLTFPGFEDCAIHLREADRWRCVVRTGWRELLAAEIDVCPADLESNSVRSGAGFLELAARGTETVHIPDLGRLEKHGAQNGGSLICVPIRTCDTFYGVLCVANSEPFRFSVMHERLMGLAADIVAEKLLCRFLLMPSSASKRSGRIESSSVLARFSEQSKATGSLVWRPRTAARVLADLQDRVDLEAHLRRALGSLDHHGGAHALCVVDVDQLRVINDTCGHDAGDELLRQVVLLIRRQLRGDDVLVRLGGDEFGLLLWDCPRHAALGVAEALRQALCRIRFQWQGNSHRVRASFGLVCVQNPQDSPSSLLNAANAACHGAKALGGDRVHLYEKDDETMQRHFQDMRWVTQVNRALEDEALVLHVQPILPLGSPAVGEDTVLGEVLLRIRDASGELVPAGRFLPAAERYGLSTPLDRWVVERALGWLAKIVATSKSLPTLWINLSGHSLSDPDFHQSIIRLLSESAVPGECLCFEITETAAIARMNVALHFIDSVRKLGCRFALDDFGSGMSSFAYLKSMDVDYVKIDGSFVRDLLDDARSLAVVRSMNEIAHAMGKRTVAEWVETEAVREALREIGVDYVQGYLLGHPQPLPQDAQRVVAPGDKLQDELTKIPAATSEGQRREPEY